MDISYAYTLVKFPLYNSLAVVLDGSSTSSCSLVNHTVSTLTPKTKGSSESTHLNQLTNWNTLAFGVLVKSV